MSNSPHVAYDPSDMQEMDALIAARIGTPRAELAAKKRLETAGDVLRWLAQKDR